MIKSVTGTGRTSGYRLLAIAALALTACGGDGGSDAAQDSSAPTEAIVATTEAPASTSAAAGASATTGPTGSSTAATFDQAVYDDALAELVSAAEEEGTLVVYSSQNTDPFNELVEAFRAAYPSIDVQSARMVDTEMIPRLDTELSTGANGADLAVTAALDWVQLQADQGNFVDASVSPSIAGLGRYDADQFVHEGNYFEVGAALATFAWNTELVPDGLTSYEDIVADPELQRRVGVVDPAISSAAVDFWLWLEETFGTDYVEQLAELEPRIYAGAQPMIEAISSGEISVGTFASTSVLAGSIEAGAPVEYALDPAGVWGIRFYGAIPKSAQHPAAAALFAEFMLSPEGQEIVNVNAASVLPDIPGTLTTSANARIWDVEATSPDAVAEYNARWNELFR